MTGEVGRALAAKLGIREGMTVTILGAPEDLRIDLPQGVRLRRQARGAAEVIVAFIKKRTDFERRVSSLEKMIFPDGALWIAWPKRASGIPTDVTDDVVREIALPEGLVDNKVCAVDDTWTALRLVWRRELRGQVPIRG
jgi:hypothetical protein